MLSLNSGNYLASFCTLVRNRTLTFMSSADFFLNSLMTGTNDYIGSELNVFLLFFAFFSLVLFYYWMKHCETERLPALIPNALWSRSEFTTIAVCVFFSNASFTALEQYINFYFQEVQHITALGAALRYLPAPLSAVISGLTVGNVLHFVDARSIVVVTTLLSCAPAILMALINIKWPYWAGTFPAVILAPTGPDTLFTVAAILFSDIFPPEATTLAMSVFITIGQVGKSVGITAATLLANRRNSGSGPATGQELMGGYRAVFWLCFGASCLSLLVSLWGLQNVGVVGRSRARASAGGAVAA